MRFRSGLAALVLATAALAAAPGVTRGETVTATDAIAGGAPPTYQTAYAVTRATSFVGIVVISAKDSGSAVALSLKSSSARNLGVTVSMVQLQTNHATASPGWSERLRADSLDFLPAMYSTSYRSGTLARMRNQRTRHATNPQRPHDARTWRTAPARLQV